ncbi:hypothetical protein JI59_24030 (plasmid) [Novosphingobium pentaromativorans US6-1]|nr:hypothetical protein JI59_24030 [Novosphingobium pentaromativorans US6-1]
MWGHGSFAARGLGFERFGGKGQGLCRRASFGMSCRGSRTVSPNPDAPRSGNVVANVGLTAETLT